MPTPQPLDALLLLAAFIGSVHTIAGPDHYIPFIAMSRAGRWSLGKTVAITVACGVGHVAGSIVLGLLGIALGWAVGGLEWFEGARGSVAGWLLLGFGLAYTAWGIHRAIRNRPHTHWHAHADGVVHTHEHGHHAEHAHVHEDRANPRSMTPWVLFTIFVFGPCEPLIPILMYPAAMKSVSGLLLVTGVFAATTILTMTTIVTLAHLGLARLRSAVLERYAHALAGGAIALCGVAIQLGL